MTYHFGTGLGAPTDPRYLAFLNGLKTLESTPGRSWWWRWSASSSTWRTFEVTTAFVDRRIPDTSPGLAVVVSSSWDFSNNRAQPSFDVNELQVPELWRRLEATWTKYKTSYPSMVWSPLEGGDWRTPLENADPVPGPGPGPGSGKDLPPECVERVNQVWRWHHAGHITRDQAQLMVNDIVDECT